MYSHIHRYNEMWSRGEIDRPLVILIGGYAGTGKSTLAKQIVDHFPFTNVLQTAILRALMRTCITREENPFLYVHTYDLATVDGGQRVIPLQDRYRAQVEPIAKFINEIVDFAGTEKQQRVIEGAHIFPRFLRVSPSVIPVEVYLKVSDVEVHKHTIAGPTHNRKLSAEQFKAGRAIHDYIVEEAKTMGKEVYEFNEAYDKSMQYIDSVLGKYLEKTDKLIRNK